MAGDLGMDAGQVHDNARAVLRFWLEETPWKKRFAVDDALDADIRARFGPLRDAVLASDAEGWTGDPTALLAAIILLDQFSRNLHRGHAEAFAGDALARALTKRSIDEGWDTDMPVDEREFLYMPLMHSEDAADQRLSIAKFTDLGDAKNLKYAHAHADVIERFGRFPSRNAVLGRGSTAEEVEYLSQPGAGW